MKIVTPAAFNLAKTKGLTADNNKNSMETSSFSQLMRNMFNEANSLQKESNNVTEKFITGYPVELHDVMLMAEKADLALRQTVQIRNKLLEAYKEISHMQV